jgi:F-type H+-transporting ATPase subunit a
MDHHTTWFNFLPFFHAVEHWFQGITHEGLLFKSPVGAQHFFAGILTTLVIFIVALRARAQLARSKDPIIPDPEPSIRNFFELILEALYRQSKQIIGKDARRYFPVIGTLAIFIFFSNVLGLVPGFSPPTNNWNTTFACAFFVFVYYNFQGIRVQGLGKHLAHMANPAGTSWGWFLSPLMFPLEVVSHCARPFSLTVRLAANMTGDHAVLFAFLGLVPVLVPLPFLTLGLLVCVIQTLVFVLLTMIYIGLATADAHGHDDHGHAEAHGHEAAHAH